MEKLKYLPVLMYHHIIDKSLAKSWNNFCVEPVQFEKQMDLLVRLRYDCLNFEDLDNILKGRKKCPDKPVIITFDDAYSETINNVIPLLALRNLKSVFSVVTGCIGKQSSWEIEGSEYPVVTEEQIKKNIGPLVSFESHTEKHACLTSHSAQEVEKELTGSKITLESLTGQKVRAVFYPYGSYNENIKSLSAGAGYSFGVAIASSKRTVIQDLYEIRRVFIKPSDSLSAFKRKITPWYLWFRGIKEARRVGRRL
ncbi:MAG: polysaccharide deacetylase family protein [Candidatus Firestonebacteria bacterium]